MFLIIYQRVMFHCHYHQPFDTALARLLRANGRDFCHVQSWEALDFYKKLGFYIEFERKGFDKDSIFYFLRKNLI